MGENDGGGGHNPPGIPDRAEADGEGLPVDKEGLAGQDIGVSKVYSAATGGHHNIRVRNRTRQPARVGAYTARSIQDIPEEVGRREKREGRVSVPEGFREIREDLTIDRATNVTIGFRKGSDPGCLLVAFFQCLTCEADFVWNSAEGWFECDSCEAELTIAEAAFLKNMVLTATIQLNEHKPDLKMILPSLITKRRSIWDWLKFWKREKAPPV